MEDKTEKDLILHTWNVRSSKSHMNQHALALHLDREKPDILVVTESWLNVKCPYLH